MRGIFLPGERRVEIRDVPVPRPGPEQLLIAVRASTICGSDLRSIYREHTGLGPEAYQNVIAGHEPAGEIVEAGPGCRRFGVGDRVLVYHIRGCGLCQDCRLGYEISCSESEREAYGWQRDGGHADFLLADERSCLALPDELSYVDGACVACTFGTAYEGLRRAGTSGADSALVVGLGPVGLAAAVLARALGARPVVGVDLSGERVELALLIGAVDVAVRSEDAAKAVATATRGHGCEVTVDCTGTLAGRRTALELARRRGRCILLGEGGTLQVEASPILIHQQLTLIGSWVTSVWRMEQLVEHLVRWGLHPEQSVTHVFPLEHADEAYALADSGAAGKIALVPS
jgi:threonine dehydrogenase-like Zn-dependent dehydrogenase